MTAEAQQELFHTVRFNRSEREVFRRRERLTVSQWAERNLVLKSGPRPGPWHNSVTAYLTEIMDTWGLPYVRKVVLCAPPQTGKTQAMYNCLGFAASESPGAALVVMQDEQMAKKVSKRRIKPMFDASPRLANLKTGNQDDFANLSVTLANGMTIDLGWARSPGSLATQAIEQIYLDETDKYPASLANETDPVSLAEVRARTFPWTSKVFMASSPTVPKGYIWVGLNDCQEIRDYYVPCPFCGVFQTMVFKHIKWPEGERDSKKIKAERLAWYECPHCGAHWSDADRDRAVRKGCWEPREAVERPSSVGFHLRVYNSPFVSLSECAAVFLESRNDKIKFRHFMNAYEAEPWVDYAVEREEDRILALKDERPRGLVPRDVACITAAIDTQDLGFYYEIRAWGWGDNSESWQIREGYVESWEGLDRILFHDRYKDAAGREYAVQFGLMDSGGHRTSEVYDYCRARPMVKPVKGEQRMNTPWKITQIDTYPNGKPMRGGVKLYRINTTYYKDQLARLLEIAPADPGAWHLHSETTGDYAANMCSEYQDERGVWLCPQNKANHYWDCGVYGLAAQDIIGRKFWTKPSENQTAKPVKKMHSKGVKI